jgi:hypothetical protein
MKQYLMAAACVAALCASAPAFAQTSTSPASPIVPSSSAPATNGGCLPGQALDATGNACPASTAQAPAVPATPNAAPSDTAQAPAIPATPNAAPADTAQATPPSSSAPTSDVASAAGSSFVANQSDNQYLASAIMGKDVLDSSGNKIGSAKDILFDAQGKMAAVVVGVGGFLGIGEKSIAISFDQVKPGKDANGNVTLNASVSQDDVNGAPGFMTLDYQKSSSK